MKAILKKVLPTWRAFERDTHVGPIRDADHYDTMVALMNALIDEIGTNKTHPLCGLLYLVGEHIREYDTRHHPAAGVSGVEMLRFLIQQHGLKQSDLPEIGTQSVVSETLKGKRKLNVRQITKLSARFGLPADTFIGKDSAAA
jgi:HTH-type transcriptional regulator / antitoxin HigA